MNFEDEGEDEDFFDEIKPEDNIIPYEKRDGVEVSYIVKQNEKISTLVQEQVYK